MREFISKAAQETEENWVKPKWSGALGQGGASVPSSGKPTERPIELQKVQLAFCVDCSGSMDHMVALVYATIISILKMHPALMKIVFTFLRFSGDFHIYKGIFKTDKMVKVQDVNDKYSNMGLSLNKVFHETYGSVTNFTSALTNQLIKLLNDGYNVMIFSDSDITGGENLVELKKVLVHKGRGKVFIIFDSKNTYINFRKNSGGMATVYMSHL